MFASPGRDRFAIRSTANADARGRAERFAAALQLPWHAHFAGDADGSIRFMRRLSRKVHSVNPPYVAYRRIVETPAIHASFAHSILRNNRTTFSAVRPSPHTSVIFRRTATRSGLSRHHCSN